MTNIRFIDPLNIIDNSCIKFYVLLIYRARLLSTISHCLSLILDLSVAMNYVVNNTPFYLTCCY